MHCSFCCCVFVLYFFNDLRNLVIYYNKIFKLELLDLSWLREVPNEGKSRVRKFLEYILYLSFWILKIQVNIFFSLTLSHETFGRFPWIKDRFISHAPLLLLLFISFITNYFSHDNGKNGVTKKECFRYNPFYISKKKQCLKMFWYHKLKTIRITFMEKNP